MDNVISNNNYTFHTCLPSTPKSIWKSKIMAYFLTGNNVYKRAESQVEKAYAVLLRNSSSYGAVICLGIGLDEKGKQQDEIQLSKKKESWRNIILTFFPLVDTERDVHKFKALKSELQKHGIIKLT